VSSVVYQTVIPIEPRSKKNNVQIAFNPRTHRPFVTQSKTYKQFEKDCGYYLKHKPPAPINYPVNVQCIFYRSTRRVFDASNGIAAIDDILVKYGIIEDDKFEIVAGHDGTRVRIDKDNPRIEITITRMGEDDL